MKIEKINELFARFAGQLLKMRWITLGIFALVIIVSVIGMKRMVKETSFDDYFIGADYADGLRTLSSIWALLLVIALTLAVGFVGIRISAAKMKSGKKLG